MVPIAVAVYTPRVCKPQTVISAGAEVQTAASHSYFERRSGVLANLRHNNRQSSCNHHSRSCATWCCETVRESLNNDVFRYSVHNLSSVLVAQWHKPLLIGHSAWISVDLVPRVVWGLSPAVAIIAYTKYSLQALQDYWKEMVYRCVFFVKRSVSYSKAAEIELSLA